MQKTYALFDFDGTLIRGDSILLFMRYAWHRKLCSAVDLLRFLTAGTLFVLKLITPKRAKEMGMHFLNGKERAVYTRAAEDFCRDVLLPRLYPQGLEAIRRHQAAGHEVLLVSASPAFYLAPLKRMLGLTAVIATQFATDRSGRFSDEIIGENCRGEHKPQRVREYLRQTGSQLDYESSSAYGDSAHDLPMLAMCGHIYIVNPNKMLQTTLGQMQRVTILNWKENP